MNKSQQETKANCAMLLIWVFFLKALKTFFSAFASFQVLGSYMITGAVLVVIRHILGWTVPREVGWLFTNHRVSDLTPGPCILHVNMSLGRYQTRNSSRCVCVCV